MLLHYHNGIMVNHRLWRRDAKGRRRFVFAVGRFALVYAHDLLCAVKTRSERAKDASQG